MQFPPTRRLGGPLGPRNFGPTLEALPHLFAVLRRGQQMPSGAKVLGNGTICGQKSLGMPRGFKPLHAIFPLACRSMGVLTPVVEVTTLAMFDPRQALPLRRPVALELIRDDHPWRILEPFKQLGVPIASVQETSIRGSRGKSVEENEGHFPRLTWAKTPGFLRV
jgi:hypothetical protein